jgi:hypothetical protein
MLAVCTDDQEVEISGTANDLRAVHLAIIRLLSSDEISMSIPVAAVDPSPYTRSLPGLLFQRAVGPTLASVKDSGLVVAGSDDSLARFATWFNLPSDAQPGYHSHFEPLTGDQYHSSDSIPLVVALSQAGA